MYTKLRLVCARFGCERPTEGFSPVIRSNMPWDKRSATGHLWFAPTCAHCEQKHNSRSPTTLVYILEQWAHRPRINLLAVLQVDDDHLTKLIDHLGE